MFDYRGREKRGIPAVQSFVSRQVPFEKFRAAHAAERAALVSLHAKESGCDFAAALVGRREKLSDLSESAKARSLKRYGVPASHREEFFAAAAEAFEFERGFQLNCVN